MHHDFEDIEVKANAPALLEEDVYKRQLLQSVVSQQLIPTVEGTLIPVFEIMHTTNAIRTMIREAKVHQIDSVISTSSSLGMISMDASLLKLYTQGIITEETALHYASSVDMMEKRLNAFR